MSIPQQFAATVQAAAQAYGLPAEILDLIITDESSWNPHAVGDNGSSYGLAQIHLPAHPDVTQQQAQDPTFAIFWTAKELGQAYQKFGGDLAATLLYHNNPAGAEYLAQNDAFGPTPSLAAASQRYLNAVLAPYGGIKGVNKQAMLTKLQLPDPSQLSAQGTGSEATLGTANTTATDTSASTTPSTPPDPKTGMMLALMNLFGMPTPQASQSTADTSAPNQPSVTVPGTDATTGAPTTGTQQTATAPNLTGTAPVGVPTTSGSPLQALPPVEAPATPPAQQKLAPSLAPPKAPSSPNLMP